MTWGPLVDEVLTYRYLDHEDQEPDCDARHFHADHFDHHTDPAARDEL